MSEGITLKRIIDMDEAAELTSSDYALVDSATGGPKKFAIGQELGEIKDGLTDLNEDIANIISEDLKQALLQLASKVAYIDDDGQDYYDALEEALYPPAELVSISAVYTQSGTVYDTDSLDDLKSDLVVTALYDDTTTETITTYTLSGTLTTGTSTITVTYGGKTTSFNVTVTHEDREERFGTFVNGHALSKITSGTTIPIGGIYVSSASARAAFSTPIVNENYVFTVTDSTKYNIAVYDVTDDTPISTFYAGAIEHVYYTGGSKTIAWASTDSASTQYVMVALKKLDNTPFTTAELANGAEAVFTYTTS